MSHSLLKTQPNFTACHILLLVFGLCIIAFFAVITGLGAELIRPTGHPIRGYASIAAYVLLASLIFSVSVFLVRNVAIRSWLTSAFFVVSIVYGFWITYSIRSEERQFIQHNGLERRDEHRIQNVRPEE